MTPAKLQVRKRYLSAFSLLALLALLLTLLAACGQEKKAEVSKPASVMITVRDNYFDPASVSVTPNQKVTVTFVNKGANIHIVEIQGLSPESTLQPGQSKTVVLNPRERSYKMYDELYVDKGMVGAFVGGKDTTSSTTAGNSDITVRQAITTYRGYVADQSDILVQQTKLFTDAVIKGDMEQAKSLYATTRQYYERIEPIAEQFGQLDASIDARENDVPLNEWRGFHRIEKALWQEKTTKGQEQNARQLMTDVLALREKIKDVPLTATDIIDGAVGLLDEASKTKMTGEEDRYSHTDITDLAANVEGSQAAFEVFKPFLTKKNPALLTEISNHFQQTSDMLNGYRKGNTFVSFNTLKTSDTHKLSQSIDATAEPLSKVAVELPKE
ncbi:iron uptake system protein EfeO [Ktedonospora formicarum]|uniref:Iron uptake system component EfeO n=1 Tax=Ktedonospora formicarum TaxID=2778364 RepID=A0A8J3HXW2_9CHLR|nr:iron uptake system protein EfeO [Ktedonospora formicarum]GHO46202.1 iron uptake system component EfeO [Ktedonospora formicarum]